jgi:hypothetical protein
LINEDGRSWQRISFTFTAENASIYLCIGNFYGNEEINYLEAKDAPEFTADEYPYNLAYFFIDDVMICSTKK